MRTLEQDKAEQLLQIIQNKPRQHIVHFSEGSHILTKTLSKLCKEHKHFYTLYCIKDVFYDKSMTKYVNQPHMNITKLNLHTPSYITQSIEYDYLISTLDFSQEDKGLFLEKCHPLIKTDANIIIIIPNSAYSDREEWKERLEEKYYRSPNIIDDLFAHYDVIVSTAMRKKEPS